MRKSSILGSMFIGLFGVPFFAMGLLFAVKMAQTAGTPGNKNASIGIAMGTFFACIGLGLMALAVASYRLGKKQEASMAAYPGAPWMWRDDWAIGRSNGKRAAANITMWVFAAFWDFISFTAAALALPKLMAGDLRILFVMVFPLIGVILTVVAVLGTLRSQRFGQTSFWFATNPFTPGGKLSGFIHLKMPTAASHGFDVQLSCIRRVTSGSGNNRSTVDNILWQDEKNIPSEQLARGDSDAQVPVEFAIPTDAAVTNDDNPNDKILWKLHAKADVPGVDFKDDYELPVFRTQKQSSMAAAASGWVDSGAHDRDEFAAPRTGFGASTSGTSQVSDEPVVPPSKTHIVITEDGASTKVYFPPLRNPGQAVAFLGFTAVWTAVVYMLFTHDAPWIFRIVFGGSEVLIGLALINMVFGSSTIRVGEGTLSIRKAIMGIGSMKTMPLDGVKSVEPVSQGQADASGTAKFGVFIELTDGRTFRVASSSLSRIEARWIVAALDRAMGRKEETTPQFRPVVMALPAQTSGGGVVKIGGVSTSKISRVIGALFFIVWISFIGRFFFHFATISSKAKAATRSTPARPIQPVKGPLSAEEETRILNLPAQEQAEELLERSIQHDERALQLFEERIEGWTSELHLTDKMRRLEDQSRYSTDLRVRQANEDVELALDGWHRDSNAVDLLIGRASSDPQYKAAALYFLGMEGGRGVEKQHVYEVLKEYALHDSDANSRQWAVEGLRFLQTDEALDTLWESFTTDASFSVRNRAGCNISDCGVFTREQRMRYVPKLLGLLNDPSVNPQMRTWCYMALREITDASLPDDPAAWNRWYSERGGETLAAFQRLPWYQVRGDQ